MKPFAATTSAASMGAPASSGGCVLANDLTAGLLDAVSAESDDFVPPVK